MFRLSILVGISCSLLMQLILLDVLKGDTVKALYNSLIQDDLKGSLVIERKISLDSHSLTPTRIGKALDLFLTQRPWWWVEKEPMEYSITRSNITTDKNVSSIVLRRFGKVWDSIFKQIVNTQYPPNCAEAPLLATTSLKFDSFGNNFYNYVINKASFSKAIVVPFPEQHEHVSFLDPGTCLHMKNPFDCAFLRPTNCSYPDRLINRLKQRKHDCQFFTSADSAGVCLDEVKINGSDTGSKFRNYVESIERLRILSKPEHLPSVLGHMSHGLYSKTGLVNSSHSVNPYGLFFGYAFLYRPNYHFRSLIAQVLDDWTKSLKEPFPVNGDCVAVIIRRGKDRVHGSDNMTEWCIKHEIQPNGACYNDATRRVEHNRGCQYYADYGCQTGMPYGDLTLDKALKAVQTISHSKNVLLRCDDAGWLSEQIRSTPTNLTLFPFSPPPNHRLSSLGGASYLAAAQLSGRCSALVGHTGSAVTMFFYNILCVRHNNKYGKCPDLYNFSEG